MARQPGRLITTASADVALKGLAYLLEAMAKLRTERDDVRLTIIGKPRAGASNDLIDKLGLRPHIDFVSGVTDERIVELYAEAELAVVPSLYEGFSLPAIEAMGTGTCLVATDGGALPEVTGRDGETVLQARAGDVESLLAALRRGLDDDALRERDRRGRTPAGGRAVELEALRPAHRRPVPRGAGDAGQRRQAGPQRPAHGPALMLTVRFDRLGVRPGDLVLDAGAGFGRHAFALARAGADVVALDYADDEVQGTRATFGGMIDAGEIDPARYVGALRGDATRLPFADATFDRVITSEVLEHIQDDVGRARRAAPGAQARRHVRRHRAHGVAGEGQLAAQRRVPRTEERRRPRADLQLDRAASAKLRTAGLDVTGSHHAHALHSPYWWLKCAVGPRRDGQPGGQRLPRACWSGRSSSSPARCASSSAPCRPVIGKSYVVYARSARVLTPARTTLVRRVPRDDRARCA